MTRHTDDELAAALRYEASIKRMDPEMVHVADAFEEAAERIGIISALRDALDVAAFVILNRDRSEIEAQVLGIVKAALAKARGEQP